MMHIRYHKVTEPLHTLNAFSAIFATRNDFLTTTGNRMRVLCRGFFFIHLFIYLFVQRALFVPKATCSPVRIVV